MATGGSRFANEALENIARLADGRPRKVRLVTGGTSAAAPGCMDQAAALERFRLQVAGTPMRTRTGWGWWWELSDMTLPAGGRRVVARGHSRTWPEALRIAFWARRQVIESGAYLRWS
jgi:hypothetical protein